MMRTVAGIEKTDIDTLITILWASALNLKPLIANVARRSHNEVEK